MSRAVPVTVAVPTRVIMPGRVVMAIAPSVAAAAPVRNTRARAGGGRLVRSIVRHDGRRHCASPAGAAA